MPAALDEVHRQAELPAEVEDLHRQQLRTEVDYVAGRIAEAFVRIPRH